jgi:hypothetical protein
MLRAANPPISRLQMLPSGNIIVTVRFAINAKRYSEEGGKVSLQIRPRISSPSISIADITFDSLSAVERGIRAAGISTIGTMVPIRIPPPRRRRLEATSALISPTKVIGKSVVRNSANDGEKSGPEITTNLMRNLVYYLKKDPASLGIGESSFIDVNYGVPQDSNSIHYVSTGESYEIETTEIETDYQIIERTVEVSRSDFESGEVYEFQYHNKDRIEVLEIDIADKIENLLSGLSLSDGKSTSYARYRKSFSDYSFLQYPENLFTSDPATPNPGSINGLLPSSAGASFFLRTVGLSQEGDITNEIGFYNPGTAISGLEVPFYIDSRNVIVIPSNSIPHNAKSVIVKFRAVSGAGRLVGESVRISSGDNDVRILISRNIKGSLTFGDTYNVSLEFELLYGAKLVSSNYIAWKHIRPTQLTSEVDVEILQLSKGAVPKFQIDFKGKNSTDVLEIDVESISLSTPGQTSATSIISGSGNSLISVEWQPDSFWNVPTDEIYGRHYKFFLNRVTGSGRVPVAIADIAIEGNISQINLATITSLKVSTLPGRSNIVQWSILGNPATVDHYQVYGTYLGIEKLLGTSFKKMYFIDKSGLFKLPGPVVYRVVPIYNDFTIGTSAITDPVVVNSITIPPELMPNFENNQSILGVSTFVITNTAATSEITSPGVPATSATSTTISSATSTVTVPTTTRTSPKPASETAGGTTDAATASSTAAAPSRVTSGSKITLSKRPAPAGISLPTDSSTIKAPPISREGSLGETISTRKLTSRLADSIAREVEIANQTTDKNTRGI